ncbi:MAG: hypothetical protein E6767_03435 [Dysgonomonas sp.]|nr:hypothetical protein [Dysgonomonas sp.]
MKKIILYFLCTALVAGTITSCGSKSNSNDANKTEATDKKTEKGPKAAKEKYIKLAEATNTLLPMPVPGGIRMDKAEAVSDKEFKFYYTFTTEPVIGVDEFVRSAKLPLAVALREGQSDDIKMFRDDKMTIVYAYFKMDGSLFAEIAISPDDYLK